MKKETIESTYPVYVTTNYEIFKRLTGNRDIPESRISRIVNSIQNVGWIRNPIVVNENMEVIDGQGRLTALQRLGMPVEYIIAEGAGTKECIHMNMNMVNWSQADFIKSYAEQGNINYQRLLSLMDKYVGGNLHIIFSALFKVSKPKHREIKEGNLRVTEEQYLAAAERLDYVQPIMKKLNAKRLPGSIITLMQTLTYYYDFEEVDKARLRRKVEKYIYNANPWVDCFDCEREVEVAYNYHASAEEKQSIQHLIKEARMRRQLEINEDNRLRAFKRTKKGVQGFIDQKPYEDDRLEEEDDE